MVLWSCPEAARVSNQLLNCSAAARAVQTVSFKTLFETASDDRPLWRNVDQRVVVRRRCRYCCRYCCRHCHHCHCVIINLLNLLSPYSLLSNRSLSPFFLFPYCLRCRRRRRCWRCRYTANADCARSWRPVLGALSCGVTRKSQLCDKVKFPRVATVPRCWYEDCQNKRQPTQPGIGRIQTYIYCGSVFVSLAALSEKRQPRIKVGLSGIKVVLKLY